MKYIKKNLDVVDAFLLVDGDTLKWPDWISACMGPPQNTVEWAYHEETGALCGLLISTPFGRLCAPFGSWIIRTRNGELYPCSPSVFEATYEPVEGEEAWTPETSQPS